MEILGNIFIGFIAVSGLLGAVRLISMGPRRFDQTYDRIPMGAGAVSVRMEHLRSEMQSRRKESERLRIAAERSKR